MTTQTHWTGFSVVDALFKMGADFVRQLESGASLAQLRRSKLAETLGVSKGRVSQVLNNPGNLTLKKMIEYGTALGKKVSVVVYDDSEPSQPPIAGEIFVACWERAGRPRDFFELQPFGTSGGVKL